MVVFGHGSFSIKKYNPANLKIPSNSGWEGVTIEIRQRYAHLFWIPFFPIGKLYGLKKPGEKDLYEMPEDLKTHIKTHFSSELKTPWYSWSLFYIGALVGLFFWVSDLRSSHRNKNSSKEYEARQELMIEYPTTGDYYHLSKNYSENRYYKVVADKGNKIEFITIPENNSLSETDKYEAFDEMVEMEESKITISKALLKTALKNEVELEGCEGCKLNSIDRRVYKTRN